MDRNKQQSESIFSPDEQAMADEFRVNPVIIQLLRKRNIRSKEEIETFLYPTLAKLPPPDLFFGIREAVNLITQSIEEKRNIIIWGDYDVDGVTATALLVNFFRQTGVEPLYHIPDRLVDGYGLNSRTLAKIRKNVVGDKPLLITVDCGISNISEVRRAKELGFQVIVTDHHELPDELVPADVIVNPKYGKVDSVFRDLAGVGVAFYLAAGLRAGLNAAGYFQDNKLDSPNLKWFLSFVAIGSIADMVPLTGINRILVKAGFEALGSMDHPGLNALLESCDIHTTLITADDIGFGVAPKVNAAGRIGKALKALDLLLSDNSAQSVKLANSLTRLNNKRKKITREVFESVSQRAHECIQNGDSAIIVEGEYHPGVIGIVASQILERYDVPVILFGRDENEDGVILLKGSARSVEGVDIFAVLQSCERYLVKWGGHRQAAGMSLLQENFSGFKEIVNLLVKKLTRDQSAGKSYAVDLEVSVETVFAKPMIRQLQLLEPYGVGNWLPIFKDRSIEPVQITTVGNGGDHIKMRFRGKYGNQDGIGFGLGKKINALREKRNHSIVYSPMLSRYKKSANWQVKILSIDP